LAPCSVEALHKYFTDFGKDKWDLSVGIGNQEFPAGTGAWSHDGKSILVAGWQRQASIWNPANGRFISGIRGNRLKSNPLDVMVSDIAGSADGERIAIAVASGKIHIFKAGPRWRVGPLLKLEKSLGSVTSATLIPYSVPFDTHQILTDCLWLISRAPKCSYGKLMRTSPPALTWTKNQDLFGKLLPPQNASFCLQRSRREAMDVN
jgi:hypothetical protein